MTLKPISKYSRTWDISNIFAFETCGSSSKNPITYIPRSLFITYQLQKIYVSPSNSVNYVIKTFKTKWRKLNHFGCHFQSPYVRDQIYIRCSHDKTSSIQLFIKVKIPMLL